MARHSSHDLAGRARALGAPRLNNKETMTEMKARRISSMTLASLAVALAAVVLAACGSGSSSTTATQSASASPTHAPSPGTTAARAQRPRQFRKPLQRVPRMHAQTGHHAAPAQTGPAGPARRRVPRRRRRRYSQLPAGVSRAQYEAAQQKCARLRPHFRAARTADPRARCSRPRCEVRSMHAGKRHLPPGAEHAGQRPGVLDHGD